jgi:hypothetical protein
MEKYSTDVLGGSALMSHHGSSSRYNHPTIGASARQHDLHIVGIDIAKHILHLVGRDDRGTIL